ncbi:MAG: hypothetical protein N4A61_02755 [Pelagimonas sp.]|nr:hypothetical protein [Pelagimonas sp.]
MSHLGLSNTHTAKISRKLRLRMPVFGGTQGQRIAHAGDTYGGSFSAPARHIMADYFPNNSGLHLSAGISVGSGNVTGSTQNPRLGGTTYMGRYDFEIAQDRPIAPVASVGYEHHLGDRLGLSAEVGARFSRLEITTTDKNPLTPAQRSAFNNQIDHINETLAQAPVIPFVSLGLVLNF